MELVFADNLDAEEVRVRPGRPGGRQEQPLPKSDLDLDRVAVSEQVGPDDRRGCDPAGDVRQQIGAEFFERELVATAHGRDSRKSQPPSLSVSRPPIGRPMTRQWNTMSLFTNPWASKTVCRRLMRTPLPTMTSRSPGRTGPRNRASSS